MSLDEDVRERYRRLCEQVHYYDRLYRAKGSPISDEMYDALEAELTALEAGYPELKTIEEQREVPATWSLERTFLEQDVREFDQAVRVELQQASPIEYVVEPKVDGWSLQLVYDEGVLTSVRTRGLEARPRDVTAQVMSSSAIRGRLLDVSERVPRRLELRAEATVTLAAFGAVNRWRRRQGMDVLRAPFFYVSEIMSTPPGSLFAGEKVPLEIHCHGVLEVDVSLPESYDEVLGLLEKWGLTPVPDRKVCVGIEQVLARYGELLAARDGYDYEADGVVMKVNRLSWQRQLGEHTMRRAGRWKQLPRWALAFKFPYRGERATVVRLVTRKRQKGAVPLEAEVRLHEVSQVLRATVDSEAGPHWLDIHAGDVVRIRRPLGRVAEVMGIEEPAGTRQDLKGTTFVLAGKLSALDPDLAEEVALARGARIADEIDCATDFVVVGKALSRKTLERTREAGAQLITEKHFLAMLGLEMPADEVSGHQLELL
jgi:DNA ligase (NAD+)